MRRIALWLCAVVATLVAIATVGSLFRGIEYFGQRSFHMTTEQKLFAIGRGDLYWTHSIIIHNEDGKWGGYKPQSSGDWSLNKVFRRYRIVRVTDFNLAHVSEDKYGFEIYGWGILRATDAHNDMSAISGTSQCTRICAPIWPLILLGIWPTLVFLRSRRTKSRFKRGLCVKCGYDLRGSPSLCPECGTTVTNQGVRDGFFL